MKKKRDDSVSLSLKVTRIMKITLILIGDYIQLYTIYIKQKPDND